MILNTHIGKLAGYYMLGKIKHNQMEPLKLINNCNKEFSNDCRCPDCQNDNCQGGCNACLDSIHMNRIKRRYNCNNITNYYVCKYLLKYMSEFSHLFSNDRELKCLEKFNIFSIGCGPCSDLFGITNFLIKNEKKYPVKYFGCDLNEYWKDIHSNIKKTASKSVLDVECKFHRKDIFEVFKKAKKWPDPLPVNILTLHYVLSDMVANNADIESFFKRVYKYVVSKMEPDSFIIINDINHFNTRDYFDSLLRFLKTKGDYQTNRYHFENNKRNFYEYGTRHPSNSLVKKPPEICYNYNFWDFCSSSQMVIRKKS